MNLSDIMEMMIERDLEDDAPEISTEQATEQLRDAYAVFMQRHNFEPGMVIRKKRGVENSANPHRGGVAIYVSHLEQFQKGRRASGFCEDVVPFKAVDTGHPVNLTTPDCVIGHLTRDGAMVLHVADSRFYEPVA